MTMENTHHHSMSESTRTNARTNVLRDTEQYILKYAHSVVLARSCVCVCVSLNRFHDLGLMIRCSQMMFCAIHFFLPLTLISFVLAIIIFQYTYSIEITSCIRLCFCVVADFVHFKERKKTESFTFQFHEFVRFHLSSVFWPFFLYFVFFI